MIDRAQKQWATLMTCKMYKYLGSLGVSIDLALRSLGHLPVATFHGKLTTCRLARDETADGINLIRPSPAIPRIEHIALDITAFIFPLHIYPFH